MTTFEQALHIFRKDTRHLRWELLGLFLLLAVFVASGIQTWEGLQEAGGARPDSDGPFNVLLPIAWSLLIVRVVQTEALPGDRHFWLTRPYSRLGLVLAKGLFVLAFLNVPFLMAQAVIVSLDGLPLGANLGGLLWNQLLITLLLVLPIATLAALTRNLAQFFPVTLLTAALIAAPISEYSELGDMEWIRSVLGVTLGVAITAFILWRQYRLRRSANSAMLAAGMTLAAIIVYLSFPHSAAFAIQSRVIGQRDSRFALRLAPAPPRKPDNKTPNRYRQLVSLPLDVSGIDPHDLRVDSSVLTFKTLSGITRRAWGHFNLTGSQLVYSASLDRDFFDAAKDSPIKLTADFYLTQYGNSRATTVPLDGTPVYLPSAGQCGILAGYSDRTFLCRAAFAPPRPFLSDRVDRDDSADFDEPYSPFPARPTVLPVIARTYSLTGEDNRTLAPAAPERPATLRVRTPVAYFRYNMESVNIKLGEYAVSTPDDDEDSREQ
jgi:hypothetical protein